MGKTAIKRLGFTIKAAWGLLSKARHYVSPGQLSLFGTRSVQQPGIRGGRWRLTDAGQVRYDKPPTEAEKRWAARRMCPGCHGQGKVHYQGYPPEECGRCNGSGTIVPPKGKRVCTNCKGSGALHFAGHGAARCVECEGKKFVPETAPELPDWLGGITVDTSKKKLAVESYSHEWDGTPDPVRRWNGRVFYVSGGASQHLAPVEVAPEEVTGLPKFVENTKNDTNVARLRKHLQLIAQYPFLSPEGRDERVHIIESRLRELGQGKPMFEVIETVPADTAGASSGLSGTLEQPEHTGAPLEPATAVTPDPVVAPDGEPPGGLLGNLLWTRARLRRELEQEQELLRRQMADAAQPPENRVEKRRRGQSTTEWWVTSVGYHTTVPISFTTKREAIEYAIRNAEIAPDNTRNRIEEKHMLLKQYDDDIARARTDPMAKAHVRAFSRVDLRTGKTIQVAEHDDRRMAARKRIGFKKPAAAAAPQHRLVTIHQGDQDSPGHTVRVGPHPDKPGVWQVHPQDHQRARASMPQRSGPATMQEPVAPPPPGNFHAPDPAAATRLHGVADAARVGVPGMHAPPPPAKIPRLPNLAPDERRAEHTFASIYEKNPDALADAYIEKLGKGEIGDAPNIFATDDAKHLSGDWNPQGVSPEEQRTARSLYNTAVHQTANAVAKRAFMKYLADVVSKLPEGDPKRRVLITAGGVASGKDYAIANIGEVNAIAQEVGAVWNSAGEQNSTECPWVLALCRQHNIPMTFVYVHANPMETWENPKRGVVQRAAVKGRMVDARVFADSYSHGARNFNAFADHVQHDTDISTYFIDNTSATPKVLERMPAEAMTMDAEALYKRALTALGEADVPPAVKRGGSSGTRIWGPPRAA